MRKPCIKVNLNRLTIQNILTLMVQMEGGTVWFSWRSCLWHWQL